MSCVELNGIFFEASNLRNGTNPSYTSDDFLAMYPQFTNHIPAAMLSSFILLANNSLEEARWHSHWKLGMALFIAHYCQLYLNSSSPADTLLEKAKSLSKPQGLTASKSVGDVSISYDFNTISDSLKSWGTWNLTIYGQQLATIGKLVGKGGMYVW